MKAAGQMALLKILFFLFMITRKKAGKMRQSIIRPDFLYACLKKQEIHFKLAFALGFSAESKLAL